MKIRSQILKYMHLDRTYCLLTGKYCSGAFLIHGFVLFCFLTVVTKSVLLNLLRCITKLSVFLEKDALYNKAVVLKAKYSSFCGPLSFRFLIMWCEKFFLGRNVRIVLELFRLIDVHDEMVLNDVQFCAFMKTATDLSTNQIYKVFDMLDVDGSGAMDFDEFYLLICILIAVQDKAEKNFIYRHSRTVFDLLDEDNSGNISAYEFETFGFLFNLQGEAIQTIFGEFDVSGDQV
ncbi:unnamed protein product [Pocillopora meandrina]|uniref:EF-hand domain-containing protein n=1 Tax=Pocillopora meandrina TaxID=46732 RepID=A0AAU9XIM0_9CNID|nr:unnamed protein product [Pocillopora meandrina]